MTTRTRVCIYFFFSDVATNAILIPGVIVLFVNKGVFAAAASATPRNAEAASMLALGPCILLLDVYRRNHTYITAFRAAVSWTG